MAFRRKKCCITVSKFYADFNPHMQTIHSSGAGDDDDERLVSVGPHKDSGVFILLPEARLVDRVFYVSTVNNIT